MWWAGGGGARLSMNPVCLYLRYLHTLAPLLLITSHAARPKDTGDLKTHIKKIRHHTLVSYLTTFPFLSHLVRTSLNSRYATSR